MSNIDLSIIVPVYNVENYLRRGLDSILSQPSLINYEILLIDDDSSDNSGAICDEYQKHYSNVFVTHIENNGVAEARNLGISLSRGNYLYFMDPDDFLSDDFFERISPQFNKKWDVLCFGYNEIKENNNNILSCRSHTYSQTGILDKGEFRSCFVDLFKTDMMYNVWSRVYNKSFILKYDIKVYNDYKYLRFVQGEDEKESKSGFPEIRYGVFSDFSMKDIPGDGNIKWLDFDKVLRDIVKYTGESLCINSVVSKDNNLKFIEKNIAVRGYMSGDFIQIKNGKKAVKKLFTDEKIPVSIRKEHIVLTIGSCVVWIFKENKLPDDTVGLDRISELYKVDLYTNKVLKIEVLGDKYDIEHIMPLSGKNLQEIRKDAEINSEEEFRAIVNKLGNKILLEEKINRSIGNQWFRTKVSTTQKSKLGYVNSIYPLATALVETYGNDVKPYWKKDDINKATEKASNRIVRFIFG